MTIKFRWDKEAGVFVGHCKELDIYSQHPTKFGCIRALESAIHLFVETYFRIKVF